MTSLKQFFRRSLAEIALCALVVMLPAAMGSVQAQDKTPLVGRKFLGQEIMPRDGVYLVTKNANVRAEPRTSSKKIGSVRKGTKVNVVGKAKGGVGWMAVRRDGKDFGFVYAPILLPLLDGALDRDIAGRVMMSGRSPCGYTIHFGGRTVVEKERISFADYEIEYRCTNGGKTYRFHAPMFITEAPYRLTQDPVYQISIDLLGIDDDPDNIFSMIFVYRRDDNLVVFDSFSKGDIGQKPARTERSAYTVAEALAGAAETAPTAWTDEVWRKLVKLHKGNGG